MKTTQQDISNLAGCPMALVVLAVLGFIGWHVMFRSADAPAVAHADDTKYPQLESDLAAKPAEASDAQYPQPQADAVAAQESVEAQHFSDQILGKAPASSDQDLDENAYRYQLREASAPIIDGTNQIASLLRKYLSSASAAEREQLDESLDDAATDIYGGALQIAIIHPIPDDCRGAQKIAKRIAGNCETLSLEIRNWTDDHQPSHLKKVTLLEKTLTKEAAQIPGALRG